VSGKGIIKSVERQSGISSRGSGSVSRLFFYS